MDEPCFLCGDEASPDFLGFPLCEACSDDMGIEPEELDDA
jgi:hypothetical protein